MAHKVLLLSNMYPSVAKPYAGVYVKNLYHGLHALNNGSVQFELLAMPRQYTSIVGSVLKYGRFLLRSSKYLFRRYAVVHIHFFYPLIVWGTLYKLLHPQTSLVVTCHGTDINGHFSGGFSRWLVRLLSRSIDHLIVVGDELKRTTEVKLNRKVNTVWPAGIDETVFFEPCSVQQKRYDFIFVGSFTPLKGVPELISALQEITEPLSLCFVGSGPLKNSIQGLNIKHHLDLKENLPQTEIAKLYWRSRFLVLPSKSEAFGLVVSEAMYCGTPAIVSKVGGLNMQVKDGINGFFFDAVNKCSIRRELEAAMALTNEEYERLAERAKLANRQFSLAKVVTEHQKLYRRLVNEPEA